MNKTSNNFPNICRLCLKVPENEISVFREDFPKMIKILTNLQVDPQDILPKVACLPCAKEVKSAILLRKRIIRSYKTMLKNLQSTRENNYTNKRKNGQCFTEILVNQDVEEIVIITETTEHLDPPTQSENVATENHTQGFLKRLDTEKAIKNTLTPDNQKLSKGNNEGNDIKINKEIDNIVEKNLCKPNGKVKKINLKRNPLPCQICKKLILKKNMNSHLSTHNPEPIQCNLCGSICKNADSFRLHTFYYHKSSANQFVCDICGKSFRIKYNFLLHKKKDHGGEKEFQCKICGKHFYTNLQLNLHINEVHKKLKSYICKFCDKAFSQGHSLKTHIRQHTNEEPYFCDKCDHSFRHKFTLKNHLKRFHKIEEENKVFCESCNRGFASEVALKSHFVKMHEEKRCQYCSEVFANEDYLNTHLEEIHITRV